MNLPKVELTLCVLLLLGAATALTLEHHDMRSLEVAHQSLTQRLSKLNVENKVPCFQAAQLDTVTSAAALQSNELSRLRAQIGILRQQVQELILLRQRNHELLAAEAEQTNQLSPQHQFVLQHTHVLDAIKILLQAFDQYATNHDGQYPTSASQLADTITNLPGNLTLEDFEWLPPGTVNLRSERLVLRNRVRIPKPGEDPVWVYGSLDDRRPVEMTTAQDFVSN